MHIYVNIGVKRRTFVYPIVLEGDEDCHFSNLICLNLLKIYPGADFHYAGRIVGVGVVATFVNTHVGIVVTSQNFQKHSNRKCYNMKLVWN